MVHLLACGAFPPSYVLLVFSPFILFSACVWLIASGFAQAAANARSRTIDESRCLECGYDLRATPERCPECGTAAPQWVTAGELMDTDGAWEAYMTRAMEG
jgi:hypothetical protein